MTEQTDPIALKLSIRHLGGIVCVDGRAGERIVTAIADGTLVAANVVGIITTLGATLGKIDGVEDATYEGVIGILLPKYSVDVDTAVEAGKGVELVIPKAGHKYNLAIVDPGAALPNGQGFTYSTTSGNMDKSTIEAQLLAACRSARGIADTSRFAEMIWGPN